MAWLPTCGDEEDESDEDEEAPRRSSKRRSSRLGSAFWSDSPTQRSIRRVTTLGVGETGRKLSPREHGHKKVLCPDGHVMTARIVREMRKFFRCGCYRCKPLRCDDCDEIIDEVNGAFYRCKECSPRLTHCTTCARRSLNLPIEICNDEDEEYREPLDLLPGDVLLCGPTSFGIHHVVLVRSGMLPAPWMVEWLQPEPGLEIYEISTIESTQGQKGEDTWWYPASCYIQRNPYTGEAALLGDAPLNSDTIYCLDDPVDMKVLVHPLRRELGNRPLDVDVFEQVVRDLAYNSKQYGWSTAVRAWWNMQQHCVRKTSAFPPVGVFGSAAADPSAFLQQVGKSWESAPICATVAITVWQKYFVSVCDDPREAADRILKFMPCWCNATTPSKMVATLTRCDWQLRTKFDGSDQ